MFRNRQALFEQTVYHIDEICFPANWIRSYTSQIVSQLLHCTFFHL